MFICGLYLQTIRRHLKMNRFDKRAFIIFAICLILPGFSAKLEAQDIQGSHNDQLLKLIPSDCFFCVRINNFEYTLNLLDQYLSGTLPMPVTMLVRMQLANMLGSPELNGLNMTGNFAIYGLGQANSIYILIPITNYNDFITSNTNLSEPDTKGVSKITCPGMPEMLTVQIGNYSLISTQNNYKGLVEYKKLMGMETSANSEAAPLSNVLDKNEITKSTKEPFWIYGNLPELSKTLGPAMSQNVDQIKTMIGPMGSGSDIDQGQPGFADIDYENLLNEIQFISLTVNPGQAVLKVTNTISTAHGTKTAESLSPDGSMLLKIVEYLKGKKPDQSNRSVMGGCPFATG